MKSRGKVDTVKGVDEHGDFKSRQWEDKQGNPCYNFWDIEESVIKDLALIILGVALCYAYFYWEDYKNKKEIKKQERLNEIKNS